MASSLFNSDAGGVRRTWSASTVGLSKERPSSTEILQEWTTRSERGVRHENAQTSGTFQPLSADGECLLNDWFNLMQVACCGS